MRSEVMRFVKDWAKDNVSVIYEDIKEGQLSVVDAEATEEPGIGSGASPLLAYIRGARK